MAIQTKCRTPGIRRKRGDTLMETWLQMLIFGLVLGMLFLTLSSAILITASNRIQKRDEKIRKLTKENDHKQRLLDAYGIKEITIGGEEDE